MSVVQEKGLYKMSISLYIIKFNQTGRVYGPWLLQ